MAAGDDYLAELATRPAARAPATFGEIWQAEWAGAGLDTITGLGAPVGKAYEDLRQAVEGATGQPIGDAAAARGINFFHAYGIDARAAALGAIADTLPAESRKAIEPLRDIRARAADTAAAIERDRGDTANATYGLSGHATAWVAGMARQAVDPVNLGLTLATAPIGGEGALLPYLARQAAVGAGVQAVQEPVIQSRRAELGLSNGIGEAARDVLMAGAGAAGISGLFRAASYATRLYGARRPAAPVRETAPPPSDTFTGFLEPEDAAALDRGEHVDFREVQPLAAPAGYGGAFSGDFTIPTGIGPTREKLPPPAPIGPSELHTGYLEPHQAAALDRGEPVAYREVTPLGGDDHEGFGFGDFNFAPMDFEAAAALAERDQVIDGMAPPGASAVDHAALLADAGRGIEAGAEFRPTFDIAAISRLSRAAGLTDREAQLGATLGELPAGDTAAAETLARLAEIERQIADPGTSAADRKRLNARRDELLADTTPEALRAAAAPLEQRRMLEAEREGIKARLAEIEREAAEARLALASKKAAEKAAPRAPAPESAGLLGDAQLAADAERTLGQHGDIVIELENPDGTIRKVKARDLLAEAEEDAAAARELVDCLGGITEEVAT